MGEFILKPNDLQKQIDEFSSKTEAVSGIECKMEKDGLQLQSIDKYEECVNAMNELVKKFTDFAMMDKNSIQKIKAKWMNTYSEIETKTVEQIGEDKKKS